MAKEKEKQSESSDNVKCNQSQASDLQGGKLRIESLEVRHLFNASGWNVALVDESLSNQDTLIDASEADDIIQFNSETDSPVDILGKVADLAADVGRQIDELTVFSHGKEGGFYLGNELITSDDISSLSGSLSALDSILAEGASIYIASCDTGAGPEGQALVDSLAELTGARVYASDDITGAGGDWELEVGSYGSSLDVVAPFNIQAAASYEYSLGTNLLTNGDFEQPGTGAISNNWGLIAGWSSDTNPAGSGVIEQYNGQGYSGFIRDDDPVVYQTTATNIQANKTYILTFKTADNGTDLDNDGISTDGGARLKASLYYDNGGARVELESTTFTDIAYKQDFMDQTIYSVIFRTDDDIASIGHAIGVQFDNVTPVASAGDSSIHVDDVSLQVKDDTYITSQTTGNNLLTNADFELPGTGYINTGFGLVPGWSTDTAPADSGVQSLYKGNVGYTGFIMNTDPTLYQTTSTAIKANTTYTLSFWATDCYTDKDNDGLPDEEAVLQASIYYMDGGVRVPVSVDVFDYLYFDRDELNPMRYYVTFDSSDIPAAVGKTIGVAFDNTTVTAVPKSWIHIDDVLLCESNSTSTVSDTFQVGILDGVSDTTISDTVNGVDVNVTMTSAHGNFLDDSSDITIQNAALKELLGFSVDTTIDVFKFTNSADGDQQWMNIDIGDTNQKVYLLAVDVDWDYDVIKFYDGNGNLLPRNRYIDSYDISNDDIITDQYIYNSSGAFYHDGAVLTSNYTSVFDISGMKDVNVTWGDGTVWGQAQSIQWTVVVVDQAPEAVDDSADASKNVPHVIDVTANDIDRAKSGFEISNITNPANGTVTDNGDGTITYTPDTDYVGSDSFTYTIMNEYGSYSTATVSVTVAPPATDYINYWDLDETAGTTADDSTGTNDGTLVGPIWNEQGKLGGALTFDGVNDTVVIDREISEDFTISFWVRTTQTGQTGLGPDWYWGTGIIDSETNTDSNDFGISLHGNKIAFGAKDLTIASTSDINDGQWQYCVATRDMTTGLMKLYINGTLENQGVGSTVLLDASPTMTFGKMQAGWSHFNGVLDDVMIFDRALSIDEIKSLYQNVPNRAPFGGDDSITVTEDVALTTGNLLANDADYDSASISISAVTNGAHGTVVNNGDGTVTYTPAANYNGADSFTYTVSDGSLTDTVTVTVTVNAVNDAPVGTDDSITVTEDVALTTGNLLGNDSDVDGNALSISAVTNGAHGTVVNNGDGTVTYTPAANYNGADSFTYTVSDGTTTDTVTVTVTINAVNDAPVGTDDSITVTEDVALTTGNLLGNDSDVDGNALSISAVTNGAHGTVVNNGDGTVTYTPAANYNGADSFTYTVSDGTTTDTVTVNVTVNAVNDAPVGTDDSITVTEDVALTTGNLLGNDSDVDGNALSISAVTNGAHGTVVNNGDGTVTYTPAANYNGADSFTYTVSDGTLTDTVTVNVTVNAVNDAPVGTDDSITVTEDVALTTGNLLANDTDVEGNALSISAVTNGAHGTVVNNGDGTVTYTPAANYNGSDSFTYTVSDGALTDTVTVNVTINAVNDAPVGTDETINVTEDIALTTANLLANDTDVDGDVLSISAVTNGAHGTVVNNGDGTLTYTPAANYSGADSFTYTVSDGTTTDTVTVTVDVGNVNDAPVGTGDSITVTEDVALTTGNILANDTDADGDALFIDSVTNGAHGTVTNNSDGTVTYTPDANYNGADSFTYTVSDASGGTDTVTVTVTVNAVNDAPVGTDDSITVTEDVALTTGNLLGNDSDVDGNALSISAVTNGAHGTVTNNGNGTVTYTPDANYNGADSFTYTVSDGSLTDTVTVTVTVNAVNDAPVGTDDSITVTEDVAFTTGNLLANDSDVDGNALSISAVTNGAHGTVTNNGDGTVTYTPAANYNGADSFTYTVSDGDGGIDIVTVSVTVTAVNDAPAGQNDTIQVTEDVVKISGNLITNDVDVDNDALSVIAVTDGVHGTVVNNGDGTVTYTPASDYFGPDSFTYTVSDGNGGQDVITVNVNISPTNDAPVSAADSYTLLEDTPLNITDLLDNDIDIDSSDLTITGVTQGNYGTVVVNDDGTVTYTPQANYNGLDSFTYTISDGSGAISTASVVLSISPVEDSPIAVTDEFQYNGNRIVISDLLANDYDPDGDAITLVGLDLPEHGTLTTDFLGRTIYIMHSGYNGPDSINYRISDSNGNISDGVIQIQASESAAVDNTPQVDNTVNTDTNIDNGATGTDSQAGDQDESVVDDIVIPDSEPVTNGGLDAGVVNDAGPGIVPDNGNIPDNSGISVPQNDTVIGNVDINTPIINSDISGDVTQDVVYTKPVDTIDNSDNTQLNNSIVSGTSSDNSRERDREISQTADDTSDSVLDQILQDGQQQNDTSDEQQTQADSQTDSSGHSSSGSSSRFESKSLRPVIIKDPGMVINISDEKMMERAEVVMIVSESGVITGSIDDVVISPIQDELTALILNRQADMLNSESGLSDGNDAEKPALDVTAVGGTVSSVAAGIALAQSGISIAALSKSYAIINAIDPTPLIKSLTLTANGSTLSGLDVMNIKKLIK